MKCQYCQNIFGTKYSLKTHQKSAKYCLEIQKNANIDIVSDLSICKACNKSFSSHNFERHTLNCKEKLRKRIEELENIIIQKDIEISQLKKGNTIYKELSERELSCIEDIARQSHHVFHNEAVIEIEPETDSGDSDEEKDEEYELVPLDLGKGYEIEHREEDGYINISNLCKAGGKKFNGWNRLQKTKAFLQVLSESAQIHADSLIVYNCAYGKERSTWVHPQVAINIAQWISPKFDVKVSAWVYEVMMTGKVDISNTKSYRQLQEENKGHKIRIQHLTKKYVKKQPREQIIERNVVYILTTKLMKKERRYILGKATNLTNRLSTYNKSDEHQIVYYQECGDEDNMGVVETMVFNKLRTYREQANRERFVLPGDKEVSLFVDAIKECVSFVSK